MNQKGFTMIEILAVFTITAVILLIAVPQIISTLKKGNDTAYKEFEDNVFIAAEAYIQDENINITNNVTQITLEQLVNSGYLKSTLVNPKNHEKVISNTNKKIIVKVKKDSDGVLVFEIERDE